MTWEELTDILISFGERVRIVRGDDRDAVSLQVLPVKDGSDDFHGAWFISMKSDGHLNMGVYEGTENRLVGTRSIPLAELTEDFVREEVGQALAQQLTASLDPQAVADYLKKHKRGLRWYE